MEKSTHKVEVVPVTLQPHPNADSLSVVTLFGGYTACVKTADWHDGMLGAYIPPDSLVDTARPEFAFLARAGRTQERIKVKRLRGVVSMGLLIPAPAGAAVGDDLAEYFGVTHYEPPLPLYEGAHARPPRGYHPSYDVDSLRRFGHLFVPGEPVWITEKIHGVNARYCWTDGALHVGSRTTWKRQEPQSLWWRVLDAHPEVAAFCEAHPDITVYGEVYGQVQDLKYGTGRNEARLAVFDLLRGTEWIAPAEARELGATLPWVPVLERAFPFELAAVLVLAEGPSLIPGAQHVREGIVVKPLVERTDSEIGRVCLKVVSNGYLERA